MRDRDLATENHKPILELHPVGDGIAFARALTRVLVRRELIIANAIPDPGGLREPAGRMIRSPSTT